MALCAGYEKREEDEKKEAMFSFSSHSIVSDEKLLERDVFAQVYSTRGDEFSEECYRNIRLGCPGLKLDFGRLFSDILATRIFFILEREVVYNVNRKQSMFGSFFERPVHHAGYGTEGLRYRYAGDFFPALPWTPLLAALRDCTVRRSGVDYNFVLINRHTDNLESEGLHVLDGEDGVDSSVSCTFLAFGNDRGLTFRCKKQKKSGANPRVFKVQMKNGGMVVMHPPTEDYVVYGYPQSPTTAAPHISLSFRRLLSEY